MAERRVSVFFYGSFINFDVLKQADLEPEGFRVARLHAWDIHIGPLATLIPKDNGVVFGIVVECTHAELDRLYAQDWVGAYLPEAVLVEVDGTFLPPDAGIRRADRRPRRNDRLSRVVHRAHPELHLIRSVVMADPIKIYGKAG